MSARAGVACADHRLSTPNPGHPDRVRPHSII
jgi:hypothetical protein